MNTLRLFCVSHDRGCQQVVLSFIEASRDSSDPLLTLPAVVFAQIIARKPASFPVMAQLRQGRMVQEAVPSRCFFWLQMAKLISPAS